MKDRSIQVSAPDVEKAIEQALTLLGLHREEAAVEVVDPGSRGILGIGARDAVVRVTPLSTQADQAVTLVDQGTDVKEDESLSLADEWDAEEEIELAEEIQPPEETESDYTLSQDQIAETARQTLAELLAKMGIEAQVVIRRVDSTADEPSPITLDVLGDNLDPLIGRQGEVLNALQYVTRLIISREVEHWVNVVVDVQRYKERRAKSLQQLAERIAERVARTKQPVALEPMPPHERRVIHVALHDHPSVTTQSVGRGEDRKVTIIPRR